MFSYYLSTMLAFEYCNLFDVFCLRFGEKLTALRPRSEEGRIQQIGMLEGDRSTGSKESNSD
jgi:hypothetical protein